MGKYKKRGGVMKFSYLTGKRFFTGFIGIFTIICVVAFAGCESSMEDGSSDLQTSLELTLESDGISSASGMSKSVTGGSGSTVPNAINVPVEANVSVAFDADINVSTLNTTTFKVTRIDTSEVLAGSVTYSNRVATFIPSRVFVFDLHHLQL